MTTAAKLADELRAAIRDHDSDSLESIALKLGSYAILRKLAVVADIPVDVLEEALAEL